MSATEMQHLFCTKEDSVSVLVEIEAQIDVKYWILDEVSMDGQFYCSENVAQLCQRIDLGVSTHGQPLDITIGMQFPPFSDLPIKKTERGCKLELGKAGLLLFSPGGLFSGKEKELVSGRLALAKFDDCSCTGAHQTCYVEYYQQFLRLLRELGAVEHGMYLIAKNAYAAFDAGMRLVYQAGMEPLVNANRN